MTNRIPVTVLTGFLGSGKTTVLRHLLTKGDQRLAVMVNEFGTVGLDGDLIKTCGFCSEEEETNRIVELNNGCLCCTVQDDFLPTINTLLDISSNLDGLIIETSGLSLPRPLLQALDWPDIRSKVYLNAVITVVDGEALSHGSPVGDLNSIEIQRADDPSLDHQTPIEDLFTDQLQYADVVLLTRADIINSIQLNDIKLKLLPRIREGVSIIPVAKGKVSPEFILGVNSFSPVLINAHDNKDEHQHDHSHVDVESYVIRLEQSLNQDALKSILPEIAHKHRILRMKGRCWLAAKQLPLQIQMVGPRYSSWFEAVPSDSWKPSSVGIELVVLSLDKDSSESVKTAIQESCVFYNN